MDSILRDLRHAFRRLRRSPAFTLIAIVSLALGIGANTAIFSLVHAILLKPTAVVQSDRVLEVWLRSSDFPYAPFSVPDYRDFQRATANVFSNTGSATFTLVPRDLGDRIESVPVEMVTGGYFPTLGLRPHLGRLLGPEDDVTPGGHPVAVLSYDYWQRAFARDPGVIGREMRVNGRNFTIVGVAPRDYDGAIRGLTPALFAPVMMINQLQPAGYDQLQSRGDHGTFVRARLRDGVTIAQAETGIAAYTADQKSKYPANWPQNAHVSAMALSEIVVSPLFDRYVVLAAGLLTVVVGMVLLIACANLASFLLAQARDRQREIAIRLAIGAGRRGLVRQLLTESVVLSLIGGVAGLVLARVLLSLLLNADLPLPVPIRVNASLNPVVLTFATAISLIAGVLFGLVPALQSTRTDVISTIKNENTGGGRTHVFSMRNTLVVGQVAVSLVLLVVAGLLMRSLQARQNIDPGFGQDPSAIVSFLVPGDRYTEPEARLFVQQFEQAVSQIPGVRKAGVMSNLHLNALSTQSIDVRVDGVQPPEGQDFFTVDQARVSDDALAALGIPVLRGRGFDRNIDRADAPRVAVVNEVFAQKFWPGEDAIGRTFRSDTVVYTVVGVAKTAKIRSLGEQPRPFVYVSYAQRYTSFLTMVVSTSGNADHVLRQIMSTLRGIDPDVLVTETKTMERHLAIMLLPAQLGAAAISAFAALALILAIIGVYGVVSYAVAKRTREVSIRLSLGGEPGALVRLLMRHGFGLVAAGAGIGLVIALLATRVLQSLLYGVEALDLLTFTAVPLILLTVGALAAWIPARRASRVDPALVLRSE